MKTIGLGISLVMLLTGCSVKEFQMFDNEDPAYISEAKSIKINYDSKIVPDDILQIDIYNMNQKSNILKDSTLLGTASSESDNQYIVTSDGTIYLPLLQEVKVEGLTVKEINKQLTQQYSRYLKQPYVKASITNHKVYVLGEVEKQGIVPLEGNAISVIEALSASGGLTDYGLRDRIHVISKERGEHKIRTLDLTKLSTLNVDNMMLTHGSIVYVEPRNAKAVKVGTEDYLPIIQVIASLAQTFLAIDYISSN